MKKLVHTFIFTIAIVTGLGVGYSALTVSSIAYGSAVAYVSEVTTNLTFEIPSQGGPEVDKTVIQSELNSVPKNTRTFNIENSERLPKISSSSFLVADVETGKILTSKNINQQMPIASITKLMTAIIADEFVGLDNKTVIDQRAIDTYGTQGDLRKNETYTVSELLYPLLLESSNDAGEALALIKGRSDFMKAMNDKAKSLGLLNTYFDDASGLSQYNVSSVTDLFRLVQYIDSYRGYIFDLTTEKKIQLGKKTWLNNSRFRSKDGYVGGKNGFTDEALKTHIVLFEEEFGDEKRTIAYIILRSNDTAYDVGLLRDFVYKNVTLK